MSKEGTNNNIYEIVRSIDEKISAIDLKLQRNTDTTEHILAQTTKTNGRMTKAELDIREMQDDRLKFKTVVAVIGFIGGIIGALAKPILDYLNR